jgi:hypothetical protein
MSDKKYKVIRTKDVTTGGRILRETVIETNGILKKFGVYVDEMSDSQVSLKTEELINNYLNGQ